MKSPSVRDRQLGATLYTLEKSGARIGSPRSVTRGTFGISTLNHRHVKLGRRVTIEFVGKKHKVNTYVLRNPTLQKWLLFSRKNGIAPFAPATVVRVFLKQEFGTSPKDYRTWRSNLHMCTKKGSIKQRLVHTASQLHHTPGVSKIFYVHPDIARMEGGGKNPELKMRKLIKKWE